MGLKSPSVSGGWRRWRLIRWTRAKVIDPTMLAIRKGAEPKELALSVALGFTTGVFPLCGLTAALCGCVALVMRFSCHPPIMMLANFAATPLELSLIVPFIRLGETVTGSSPLPISTDALWQAITGQASLRILLSLFHAVLGWAIAAPFLVWIMYRIMLPLMMQVGKLPYANPPSNNE